QPHLSPFPTRRSSDLSGSNLRRRMIVEPSAIPRLKCAKPHEWKSGARLVAGGRRHSPALHREQRANRPVRALGADQPGVEEGLEDRKSTRLNSSHVKI